MTDNKPLTPKRKRWSPQSWVQIILIAALCVVWILFALVMAVRSLNPEFGVTSESAIEAFVGVSSIFAVALGYIFGRMGSK